MKVFLYCSFRNSNGYREATLEMETGNFYSGCSKASGDIFCNVSDKTLLLSEDMDGKLMFSINGLIAGNYDKYINVVFWDESNMAVFKMFIYTMHNFTQVIQQIVAAVERDAGNKDIGYVVNKSIFKSILDNAAGESCDITASGGGSGRLLAYVGLSGNEYHSDSAWLQRLFPGERGAEVRTFNIESEESVDDYISDLIDLYNYTKPQHKNAYFIMLMVGMAAAIISLLLNL